MRYEACAGQRSPARGSVGQCAGKVRQHAHTEAAPASAGGVSVSAWGSARQHAHTGATLASAGGVSVSVRGKVRQHAQTGAALASAGGVSVSVRGKVRQHAREPQDSRTSSRTMLCMYTSMVRGVLSGLRTHAW